MLCEGIVNHFGEYAYVLSCRGLDEKIYTTLMLYVKLRAATGFAYLSIKTGNGETARLALSENPPNSTSAAYQLRHYILLHTETSWMTMVVMVIQEFTVLGQEHITS